MRILILTNHPVGLYRFRKELIEELLKNHHVILSVPDGDLIRPLETMGCTFIDTPFDRRGIDPIADLRLFHTYRRILKQVQPDLVLTYTVKPNIYGGFACRKAGVPCLANVTGLGSAVNRSGALQKLVLTMYREGLKGDDCVFFQNEANKTFMEQHGITGKRNRLLPGSGVNLQDHAFEPYPDGGQGTRFLAVTRFMKDKGVEELLDCVEAVTAVHNDVTFSLAGLFDDESYRPRVESLALTGKLRFLGYREDIHELMADSHAVIHPSYHEGLSNVLLEAAACGRPVIATNVPGCRETYVDGESGFGIPPMDSGSLIDAVEKFLNLSWEQKAEMGLKARRHVEENFDRQIVINAYLEEIGGLES